MQADTAAALAAGCAVAAGVYVTTPRREEGLLAAPTGSGTPTPPDAPSVREVAALGVNAAGLAPVPPGDILLSGNGITMLFAKRLAGAVWRVEYKGAVVIPELDGNGGSLQTALAFDVPPGESPEIENPTEAGNHRDNFGKTTSRWLDAASSKTGVYTRSQMAYYYPPGEKVMSSPRGTRARGPPSGLSDVIMKKRVDIEGNVVQYKIELAWRQDHHFSQVQPLAVYLGRDFNKAYVAKGGRAVPVNIAAHNVSPPQTSYPIILAKSPAVAVGLYVHTVPVNGRFKATWQPWYTINPREAGHKDKGKGLQRVELTAIGAVWHAGSQEDTKVRIAKAFHFGAALVFGSVAEVAQTIQRLSAGG